MKTIEYRTIDKTEWDRGPWDDEPDKVQWQDHDTGLPCLAVRHRLNGHWCGYVGVAEGHPCFGSNGEDAYLEVHGGITFGAMCDPSEPTATGVCHIAAPGEPDHVWWLGFDCAHAFDLQPRMHELLRDIWTRARLPNETYKTLRYVRDECRELAQQLKALHDCKPANP
jgi:hypothetical protein